MPDMHLLRLKIVLHIFRLSLLIYLLYFFKNFPIRLHKPGKHTANSKGYSAFFVCYYVQNRSEHQSYRQKFKY